MKKNNLSHLSPPILTQTKLYHVFENILDLKIFILHCLHHNTFELFRVA